MKENPITSDKPGGTTSRYDKLKPWTVVQDDIFHLLNSFSAKDYYKPISISNEIQVGHSRNSLENWNVHNCQQPLASCFYF